MLAGGPPRPGTRPRRRARGGAGLVREWWRFRRLLVHGMDGACVRVAVAAACPDPLDMDHDLLDETSPEQAALLAARLRSAPPQGGVPAVAVEQPVDQLGVCERAPRPCVHAFPADAEPP